MFEETLTIANALNHFMHKPYYFASIDLSPFGALQLAG
jgi:hypothetical protein